jgi:hypothetical protein
VEHDALGEGKSNLDSVEQNRTTDKPHMRNREQKSNELDFCTKNPAPATRGGTEQRFDGRKSRQAENGSCAPAKKN